MRTWHVFYNTDREIMWCSDAGVTASIISQQQEQNLRYLEVNVNGMLDASLNYINEAEDNVVGKTAFEPSIPTLEPVLGTPLSITNIPVGTKVYMDDELKTTMTDTTLNLTFTDPGQFLVLLKKTENIDYAFTLTTARES